MRLHLLQITTFLFVSSLVNIKADDDSDDADGLPADVSNDVEDGLHDLDIAKDIAAQSTGNSDKEAKTRIEKFKKAVGTEYKNYRGNRMRQKEYGQSLKDAGSGIAKFSRGVKNGDWTEIVAGTLDFVGGFLFLAVPWGPIAQGALSIISSILGIFAQKQPSTADILKSVLKEENNKIFKNNVRGVVHRFTVLETSLNRFRKQVRDAKHSPSVMREIGGQVKRYHSKYLTVGSELLPHFEQRKGEYCKKETDVPKCGKFLQLYLDLTQIRQRAYVIISSVLLETGNEEVAKNLNGTIKDIQKTDMGFYKFLVDPFHLSQEQRRVVAVLWDTRWFYPNLFKYLVILQKIFRDKDGKKGIFRDDVMLCSDFNLMGECTVYNKGEKKNFHAEWNNKFKSAFVPAGFKLLVYKEENFEKQIGSFVGPDVRSGLYYPGAISSLKIILVDINKENVLEQLRFCAQSNGDNLPAAYETTYVKFVCDHVNFGKYYDTEELSEGFNYNRKIYRMQIPSGMKVTVYTGRSFLGYRHGPFIGPMYTEYLCSDTRWSSMKVERTKRSSSSMIEVSDRVPQLTPDLPGATIVQVDVCSNKDKNSGVEIHNKFYSQGCFFPTLKYMRIPGQCEVIGYTKELKPYRGWKKPVGWKHVEGAWSQMVINAVCDGTEKDKDGEA